jgi:hypothetical protein
MSSRSFVARLQAGNFSQSWVILLTESTQRAPLRLRLGSADRSCPTSAKRVSSAQRERFPAPRPHHLHVSPTPRFASEQSLLYLRAEIPAAMLRGDCRAREIPVAGLRKEKGRAAASFAFGTSARPSSYHTFGHSSPRAEALTAVDKRRQQIFIPDTDGTRPRAVCVGLPFS